jgi:hypothetical protein
LFLSNIRLTLEKFMPLVGFLLLFGVNSFTIPSRRISRHNKVSNDSTVLTKERHLSKLCCSSWQIKHVNIILVKKTQNGNVRSFIQKSSDIRSQVMKCTRLQHKTIKRIKKEHLFTLRTKSILISFQKHIFLMQPNSCSIKEHLFMFCLFSQSNTIS